MESEHLIFGPDFVTDRQRNEAAKKAEDEKAAAAAPKPVPLKPPLTNLKPSVPVGKPAVPVGSSKPVPDIPVGTKKL
jgi:hypothetical protein